MATSATRTDRAVSTDESDDEDLAEAVVSQNPSINPAICWETQVPTFAAPSSALPQPLDVVGTVSGKPKNRKKRKMLTVGAKIESDAAKTFRESNLDNVVARQIARSREQVERSKMKEGKEEREVNLSSVGTGWDSMLDSEE